MRVGTSHRGSPVDGTPRPRRELGRSARRVGLGAFFTSVAVNAVLGLYALLAPGFGDTDRKILVTSLCATGTVFLVLACEPAWERQVLGPVPAVSSAFSAAAFAMVIGGIWSGDTSETVGKLTGTAMTIGVAGTLASLLALTKLSHRYRPALTTALALLVIAAGMIVLAVWIQPSDGWYPRALGAVLVALAALTVTIPVLHRLSLAELVAARAAGADEIAFCPFCGHRVAAAVGARAVCNLCKRRFTVDAAEEPVVDDESRRAIGTVA